MTKAAKLILAFAFLMVLSLNLISAYNYYPAFGGYHSSSSYSETPSYTQGPTYVASSPYSSTTSNTNYDSSWANYDYRGPMFERTSTYNDNLLIDQSSGSGFFSSHSNNIYSRAISNVVKEKYVGASESYVSGTQNNRASTTTTTSNPSIVYNGGFRWGQARAFDSSEYTGSNYKDYYYRPAYSDGYYNWNY